MAFAAPLLLAAGGSGGTLAAVTAAGAVAQGLSQKAAADNNARIQAQEGTLAAAQGYSAESQQRLESTKAIGRQVAAVGQAGAGYGDSAGRGLAESAKQAELDALNIRYKAGLAKWGYNTQSQLTRQEGNDAFESSVARAGTGLLKSYSSSYSNPGQVTALAG